MLLAAVAQSSAAQTLDTTWTIKGGRFGGATVSIDRSAASKKNSRFWQLAGSKTQRRIVGWNPSLLPASVAFRRGRGVTEADSAAFWDTLRRMEADMGMRLFEPATLEEGSDPVEVIVVDTRRMSSAEGVTYVTWTTSGVLYDARVVLHSRSALRNPRIVTHEMMHALGFGHTSAWSSVMSAGSNAPDRLTVIDVAYAQAALESRSQSEREDMWQRLALAVEREPQPRDRQDGFTTCPTHSPNSWQGGSSMTYRSRPPVGAITAPSCDEGKTIR
ncbi:MAG: hypothetical protein ABI681_12165 [Gemmatimonadales bacterium]